MMAPHQAHFMAADSLHAERLANAERRRLAASVLAPREGRPHVELHGRRLAAALASLLLVVALATGVAAAVNTEASTSAAPNAAGTTGGGGGGADFIR